jgi:hypothetical protein
LLYYTLMLGGPAAPGVAGVLDGSFTTEPPPAGTFASTVWNSYSVAVTNEDGSSTTVTGQVFRLQ